MFSLLFFAGLFPSISAHDPRSFYIIGELCGYGSMTADVCTNAPVAELPLFVSIALEESGHIGKAYDTLLEARSIDLGSGQRLWHHRDHRRINVTQEHLKLIEAPLDLDQWLLVVGSGPSLSLTTFTLAARYTSHTIVAAEVRPHLLTYLRWNVMHLSGVVPLGVGAADLRIEKVWLKGLAS
jgi:hypothetical protein